MKGSQETKSPVNVLAGIMQGEGTAYEKLSMIDAEEGSLWAKAQEHLQARKPKKLADFEALRGEFEAELAFTILSDRSLCPIVQQEWINAYNVRHGGDLLFSAQQHYQSEEKGQQEKVFKRLVRGFSSGLKKQSAALDAKFEEDTQLAILESLQQGRGSDQSTDWSPRFTPGTSSSSSSFQR